MGFWTRHFSSSCLSFPSCHMEIIIVPTSIFHCAVETHEQPSAKSPIARISSLLVLTLNLRMLFSTDLSIAWWVLLSDPTYSSLPIPSHFPPNFPQQPRTGVGKLHHRHNLAYHLLLYSLAAKNGFHILKWLGGAGFKRIFHDT